MTSSAHMHLPVAESYLKRMLEQACPEAITIEQVQEDNHSGSAKKQLKRTANGTYPASRE